MALQEDAESFYGRHGVNILATCTPYQVGNLPLRGEHCAWMESSAVIYANSVLGARTNCEGIASTGAASLTGKIPCWGNHLDANRHGTHLVDVRGLTVESFQDWGMLGYFAGGVAGEDHPVIIGDIARPDLTELKHFGAAAATSGGVELYHIPGITPEAPTVEAAFDGAAPACLRRSIRAGRAAGDVRDAERDRLEPTTSTSCCSAARTRRSTRSGGRRSCSTAGGCRPAPSSGSWRPASLKVVADRSGYTAVIERAGGRVLADSCPAMSRAAPPGHPGVRHRLGQAGALPARDPRHRGLVRHPRRVRRRGRHRALERGAELMSERRILHGRTVVPGVVEGEALVSHEPISGWGGIDPARGVIIERRHELYEVCFTGKILVFPSAKGSSGWSGFFQTTRLSGTAPIGMVIGRISAKSALGAVVTRVPAVTDLDADPCEVIATGDWLLLDNSTVEVTKR